ncbi:hypothetical protein MSMTP_1791 [Methanosarcina sp. MTP4]|uniref:hypothetical protein n=1 Tax=Methanosarcina sp. MTP4 TaxID=1434100 RepID=UPI000615B789|nr:hypothetical protein [Methanosarcina sp. MTP4]AKB25260.1 hypothetical protein MSMTP_1791 [Methanosarcina sp. MTP4]
MKFKYLLLLLILAGMIVTSGCMDAEAQPLIYKAPANLYRSIFFPYAGLLNQEGPEIPGGYQYPYDSSYTERPPSGNVNHENPLQGSPSSLRDATALLDSNIDKAEDIAMRIELGIKYFQADGQDIGRLQELFEEYTRLIEEAKQYRELADSAAGEENDYVTQREHLVRSQESMMQANLVLKKIFEEFQHLMPGSARINEIDRLSAEGSGKAVLSGSFTLNMHLENGVLAVLELSPDSAVYIKGAYRFEEQTEDHHTVFLYYIQSADIEIPGSRKAVLLNAENISLTASEGKGQATFFGNGTYTIEDAGGMKEEEKIWANSPAEMNIMNSKPGPDRMTPTGLRDGRTGMHRIDQGYTSR